MKTIYNPQEELRQHLRLSSTPSANRILNEFSSAMESLIIAEEFGSLVLSKEEAVKKANKYLILVTDSLKDSLTTEIMCKRGIITAIA